jgi:fibronectin type 3 domain-containing protein
MGIRSRRRPLVEVLVLIVCLLGGTRIASASNWLNHLAASSKGQAKAQTVPTAPTGLTASCPVPTTAVIKLVWTAVTHATAYTVYQSTTSATSGFALVKAGLTTPTWTTATLSATTYWYKVTVIFGNNWASVQSTVTNQATIHSTGTICTMP